MSTVLVDHAPEVVVATSNNNILVEAPYTNVVVSSGTSTVISYIQESYTPVSVGMQGPQGIPGASDNYVYLVASEAIGGHRAVTTNLAGLVYATTTSTNILGISVGSVSSGQLAQVQISGIITEPSWNWVLGNPIFVSDTGLLTQQVPETGALFIIGYPVRSTQIFIDKQAPILLG